MIPLRGLVFLDQFLIRSFVSSVRRRLFVVRDSARLRGEDFSLAFSVFILFRCGGLFNGLVACGEDLSFLRLLQMRAISRPTPLLMDSGIRSPSQANTNAGIKITASPVCYRYTFSAPGVPFFPLLPSSFSRCLVWRNLPLLLLSPC